MTEKDKVTTWDFSKIMKKIEDMGSRWQSWPQFLIKMEKHIEEISVGEVLCTKSY
jgi:hypothetical protein